MVAPAQSVRPPREVVVPLRCPAHQLPPVTKVRSTLIASSLRALEAQGLLAAYGERLSAEARAALLGTMPGAWVDIGLAFQHYEAIDSLQLTIPEQLALGGAVGQAVQGVLIGTLVRLARGIGLTPWTGVAQYARIWHRLFVGGGLLIEKVGPSEAAVTMYGLSLFSVPYFRVATRGLQQTGLSLIWAWRKVYVTEVESTETMLACRVAWV